MTVTAATTTTVVRRNGPGDVGRDDREHSGRAHQANSRTHTHTTCTHHSLLARSLACSLAAERARVSTRRTKKKRKEENRGSAIRADTRHCTLARYRLAPVLHGHTRGSLLERLVAKLRGRAPSLSRGSCPFVSRCRARAHHAPLRRPPLSLPSPFFRQPPTTPGTHSLRPLLCLLFSIRISFLPVYPPQLSFSLSRCVLTLLSFSLSPSEPHRSLLSRTSIRSLFLFSYHPRPRGKRFAGRILSPHGSRATCVRVLWQRDSLLSTGETTTLKGYVLQRMSDLPSS